MILMPVYRDWDVARLLCEQIDQQLGQFDQVKVGLVLVDDGSPVPLQGWTPFEPAHITRIDTLLLKQKSGASTSHRDGFMHDQGRDPM